jgi:hypothetical protein
MAAALNSGVQAPPTLSVFAVTRVTSSMHALREPYGTLLLQHVLGRVRVMSPILVHAYMHDHDMTDWTVVWGRERLPGGTDHKRKTIGFAEQHINVLRLLRPAPRPSHAVELALGVHFGCCSHPHQPQPRTPMSPSWRKHACTKCADAERGAPGAAARARSIQSNTPINRWRRL